MKNAKRIRQIAKCFNDFSNGNIGFITIGGIRKEGVNVTDESDGSADYWEWSDGTPWDFVVWGWNQPTNINSNGNRKDVVLLSNTGQFHDTFEWWFYYGLYKKVRYNDHKNVHISYYESIDQL